MKYEFYKNNSMDASLSLPQPVIKAVSNMSWSALLLMFCLARRQQSWQQQKEQHAPQWYHCQHIPSCLQSDDTLSGLHLLLVEQPLLFVCVLHPNVHSGLAALGLGLQGKVYRNHNTVGCVKILLDTILGACCSRIPLPKPYVDKDGTPLCYLHKDVPEAKNHVVQSISARSAI